MKRVVYLIIAVANLAYLPQLHADLSFTKDRGYEKQYRFDPTDTTQKKQAIGMLLTGFVLFIIAGVASALVPSSTGSTTPFSDPSTGNTILD